MTTAQESAADHSSFPPAAIILCGGRSSRMGVPKHALKFGEITALERVISVAEAVASPIVAVGSRDQRWPTFSQGVLKLTDELPYPGAMSGLIQGMQALPETVDRVFLLGCDFPLVVESFLSLLNEYLTPEFDIVAPVQDGFPQPLLAMYRRNVLPVTSALLSRGDRRMQSLLQECRTRLIPEETFCSADPDLQSLQNMNTPEDYQRLLRLFQSDEK